MPHAAIFRHPACIAATKGRAGMRAAAIHAPGVPEPRAKSYSNAKRVGDQVFIAGMVAWDAEMRPLAVGNAYEQSRIVFDYIRRLMEAAGGRMDDIMTITAFTTDMRHQPAFWQARAEFFSGDFPCSTLVCVHSLFLPELVIEVNATGVVGAGG
jgi:enamine deaminase RidA (YjgF/YER057c/UK114 family)